MDGPSFPTPKPSELPRLKASTFNSTDLFLAVLALVFVVLLGFLMSMGKTHKNFNVVMGFEKLQQNQKTEEASKKTEETPVKVEENNKSNESNTQKKEEKEVKKPKKKKSPAKNEEKIEEDIKVDETVEKNRRILRKSIFSREEEIPKENIPKSQKNDSENKELRKKNELWSAYVDNIKAKKYEKLTLETVQRYGNAYLERKTGKSNRAN